MLTSVGNRATSWRMAHWRRQLVPRIRAVEEELQDLTNGQLRKQSLALRYRIRSGEPMGDLLPEAYALVAEASFRALEMRHFDVQLLGGIVLFHGGIAEMETGEGKTLTATLPLYLRALAGKGAQLATVNDYLARRDAEWMSPVFKLLGLSVGVIQTDMRQPERRENYGRDITYGTAKEFGFDFLRDRLLIREQTQLAQFVGDGEGGDKPVQRRAYFVLVDEADSVLIDEARTPLIISSLPGEDEEIAAACYAWCPQVVDQFVEDEHYEYDHDKKQVELTLEGRQLVRALEKPEIMNSVGYIETYEYVERAIKVGREFFRDQHYVVRKGEDGEEEVVIVDESTGRLAEGRKWRAGIHQAVEAKEEVKVTVAAGQAARVTIQDFFLRYQFLAGMTGTASTSAREMWDIYRLRVVKIPTNRPNRREKLADAVYGSGDDKWEAIVEEVAEVHASGRPVLVGTRSIDKSEMLSERLRQRGIEHQILNANRIEAEAEIVAQAGRRGAVTIATNMAGRGTDIVLGGNAETLAWSQLQAQYESRLEVPREVWDDLVNKIESQEQMEAEGGKVKELGGLHVICSELHDSARIDRQLVGRCGRQGDPGTFHQYYALDDEILKNGFGPQRAEKLKASGALASGALRGYRRLFQAAQRKVERRYFRGRKTLLHHEKQIRRMQKEMGQDPYLDTPD